MDGIDVHAPVVDEDAEALAQAANDRSLSEALPAAKG